MCARLAADLELPSFGRTRLAAEVEAHGDELQLDGGEVQLNSEGAQIASGHGLRLFQSGRIEAASGGEVARVRAVRRVLSLVAAMIDAPDVFDGAKALLAAAERRDPQAWTVRKNVLGHVRSEYSRLRKRLHGTAAALSDRRGRYGLLSHR